MQARDFVYWLNGWFEMADKMGGGAPRVLTADQIDTIRRHLAMVFEHEIDPSMGDAERQAILSHLHAEGRQFLRDNPEIEEDLKKELVAVKASNDLDQSLLDELREDLRARQRSSPSFSPSSTKIMC